MGRLVENEILLSYQEAADKLGANLRKIYRLVKRGSLTRKKVGRGSMITLQSVEHYQQYCNFSIEQLVLRIEALERAVENLTNPQSKSDDTQQILQLNHPDIFH